METAVLYDAPHGNIVFESKEQVRAELSKIMAEQEVRMVMDSGCVFHVKRVGGNIFCHELDEGDGMIYAYYMILPDDGEAVFLGDTKSKGSPEEISELEN